jgi:KRAB domain-containing zinc finger protein
MLTKTSYLFNSFRNSQFTYHIEREHEDKRPHICHLCQKGFYKKSDLKMHLKAHEGIKDLICAVCSRTFTHLSNLNRHKLTHSTEKPFSCQLCGSRYNQMATLNQHKKKHDGVVLLDKKSSSCKKIRQFNCKYCGNKFQYKADLDLHTVRHENDAYPYSCKRCNKGFASLSGISHHVCPSSSNLVINVDADQVPGFTSERTQAEVDKVRVATSVDIHVGSEPDLAELEPPNVLQQSHVEEEETTTITDDIILNISGQEALIQALTSGKHLDATSLTIVQVEGQHWVVEGRGECHDDASQFARLELAQDICQDVVVSVPSNQSNAPVVAAPKFAVTEPAVLKVERKNGTYSCSECGKDFTRLDSLKQHFGSHNTNYSINCDVCGDKFAWATTLKRHQQKVHGAGPAKPCPTLKCEHCDRTFKTQVHMKVHVERDHMKARPHQCEICNKAFYAKDDLSSHLRIHTGEKPYECRICGKAFTHSSHRSRHERETHDDKKQFQCQVCLSGFNSKKRLVSHFQNSHPNTVDVSMLN